MSIKEMWEMGVAGFLIVVMVSIAGLFTLFLLVVCNPLAWIAGILYWLHSIGAI